MSERSVLRRELRVMFSPKVQPVWFRVLKWAIILAAIVLFGRRPYFWWGLAGVFVLALGLHLFWRWKTKAWTQPWGGWSDVGTGKES